MKTLTLELALLNARVVAKKLSANVVAKKIKSRSINQTKNKKGSFSYALIMVKS